MWLFCWAVGSARVRPEIIVLLLRRKPVRTRGRTLLCHERLLTARIDTCSQAHPATHTAASRIPANGCGDKWQLSYQCLSVGGREWGEQLPFPPAGRAL